MGSRSHIEGITQGGFTPTALDVLIEQHQKASLLDGTCEHELNVGGSDIPESSGFDPTEIDALLKCYPGSGFFFAPTMIVRLLGADVLSDAALANLRTVVYGGGPMYTQDLLHALDVFGPRLVQIYGQGESPMTITYLSKKMHEDRDSPRFLEQMASVGIARSDVEIGIVDADDRRVAQGESGEIVVRGDVVMNGYWENPEASAQTLKGGWLHTGDVGVLSEDGFLTLKDRTKDMIISGGENIYSAEVENALYQHSAVVECAVIGIPDDRWGEAVHAVVRCHDGQSVDGDALIAHCRELIAGFKCPRSISFREEPMPLSGAGKILKTDLRKPFWEGKAKAVN